MICVGDIVIWMRQGVLTAECDRGASSDCGFKHEVLDYWGEPVVDADKVPTLNGRRIIEIMDQHIRHANAKEWKLE